MEQEKPKLKELIGKSILIGITHLDYKGELTKQTQQHGIFESMDDHCIYIRLKDSDEIFSLPPDLLAFHKAKPGVYKLKSTGEVITNPDFTAVWTVHSPPPNLEDP